MDRFWINISPVSCSGGKAEPSNPILALVEEVQDNSIFEKIVICEEFDEECVYLLKAKNSIDDARLKLIKAEDALSHSEQLSDAEGLTKCMYRFLGIQTSLDECMNDFKEHIQFLEHFISNEKEHDVQYSAFKHNLVSKDKKLLNVGAMVLKEQDEYKISQEKFNSFLQKVLVEVENKDLAAAAALLSSEDAVAYRMALAELLNVIYQFECSRAKSILDVYKTYHDVY